jgi:cell division protein FtsB
MSDRNYPQGSGTGTLAPPRRRRPQATVRPPVARPQPAQAPHRPAPRQRDRERVAERAAHRMPFFLLLCGLLGGALVSTLVISTTLAAGSFEITKLQQSNDALARQRQQLEEQVAAAQSTQVIEQRAYQLGMRPVGVLRFINLKTGEIATDANSGAGPTIQVPGYTP